MRNGLKVKRAGWSGKYIFFGDGRFLMALPQGFFGFGATVPWMADPFQGDLTATDWEIVP